MILPSLPKSSITTDTAFRKDLPCRGVLFYPLVPSGSPNWPSSGEDRQAGAVKPQLNCWADGPSMITQCPIQPNTNFTYRFNVIAQEALCGGMLMSAPSVQQFMASWSFDHDPVLVLTHFQNLTRKSLLS